MAANNRAYRPGAVGESGAMDSVADHPAHSGVTVPEPGVSRRPGSARYAWAGWLEALGVALSPAIAALVLRLRLMAPSALADPAMHTTYVIDPLDVFKRYAAVYASTARMREAGRVGFLIPARLAYEAFGAVAGFFVFRYVLALIAVGPVYLLLRRLYGRAAGVVGILAVMSSPVVVTAWGTDYPDGAVLSYVLGAMACLSMPCSQRRRRTWLAAAGVLFGLAVWSHGVAVPLVGATVVGYVGVRLVRDRAALLVDLALLAGAVVAVTILLLPASAAVMGYSDFISLTWEGFRYLSQPSQIGNWHSASWRWAPYVAYLLVPPAVLVGFAVAVIRRGRAVPTPVMLVGVMAAVQLAAYALLQFASSLQTLEQYFFSSTLWCGVCLALAIAIAELARPLWKRPLARWLPAAVLLAVPLGYEADPRVPPFGWVPLGAVLAAAAIIAAAAARGGAEFRRPLAAAATAGIALAVFVGAILVLTVAPIPNHPVLPGTLPENVDTHPPYSAALGGSGRIYIDRYQIATALPAFVGPAAYRGEQVFMWWPRLDNASYVEDSGMYHDGFNSLVSQPPDLTRQDRQLLRSRCPAELLLFADSAASFPVALARLAAFRPTLMRTTDLRAGPLSLHAWLIRLGVCYRPPAHAG
jgi:Dolichyl-phosphate-mannose-protein mannosyltransferase